VLVLRLTPVSTSTIVMRAAGITALEASVITPSKEPLTACPYKELTNANATIAARQRGMAMLPPSPGRVQYTSEESSSFEVYSIMRI
jgi:hypothetical protein